MKKLLVLGMMMLMAAGTTACGKATKTTEYWEYSYETNEYELVDVEEEEIDGFLDKKVKLTSRVW